MKTATYVRGVRNLVADQRLYKLSDGGYVVVSATVVISTPETYIFAADEHGTITDWCEMDGSLKGRLDHAEALRNAGYEVVESAKATAP